MGAPSQLRLTLVSAGGGPRGLFVTSEITTGVGARAAAGPGAASAVNG